jgi:hypothetical protein
MRAVGLRFIENALCEWTSEDLAVLARLSHRMVDDFLRLAERRPDWPRQE